ncbi:ribonuclease H-like domain-containing protein [Tanacetum coccineum]
MLHPLLFYKRNNGNTNWNNGSMNNANGNNGNRGNYNNLVCKNCGLKGHTIERCFEIIGYPPSFNRNPNLNPANNFNNNRSNNVDNKETFMGNNEIKTFAGTLSFNNEQVLKLMSLLNDKFRFIAHANMAVGHPNGTLAKITHISNLRLNNNVVLFYILVVPEYCVSLLFVHKLIKDSKLSVCFDESKCLIQDLKSKKFWGLVVNLLVCIYVDVNYDKFVVSNQRSLNLSNIDHNSPCEVCHKAKQTRDPFPISEHKSTCLGELIHLDVWGPYKVISREGFRYFLTIVDDFSRSVWVYLLKTKDEVYSMLPFSVLNGKSPFSLVYGREPNLSYLRSFGCLCFSTVVKGSDKFSQKSEKCVLIGYASGKKAYKLFSLENRSVLYSRDVKFYETVFPFKMSVDESVKEHTKISTSDIFDHFESEPVSNDEEGSPGRDGRVHQLVLGYTIEQPRHDGDHHATPLDEQNTSEGNVGINQEVPIFQNDLPNITEEVGPRRSQRPFKLPARLNEFVLDDKVKYAAL